MVAAWGKGPTSGGNELPPCLRAQGIEPVFVRSELVEDAVADYLAGRTIDHSLCHH